MRKLDDKQKELDSLKDELSLQVNLKNEIFDLKARLEELTADVKKKDELLTQGSSLEIKDTETYKMLMRDYDNLTQDFENVRVDLSNCQFELRDQISRMEEMEGENEQIKFKSNILDKFFQINVRNPSQLLEDYQNGFLDDQQVLSKLQLNDSLEAGTSLRPVSKYNLQFD